jgi:hypothetical protein
MGGGEQLSLDELRQGEKEHIALYSVPYAVRPSLCSETLLELSSKLTRKNLVVDTLS